MGLIVVSGAAMNRPDQWNPAAPDQRQTQQSIPHITLQPLTGLLLPNNWTIDPFP
jgi:hypothetical protein